MFSIATKDLSINNQIRAAQVRVIDDAGAQLGVMRTRDAIELAMQKGLDLVEIAPTAQISVCRIMDYGKYKFDKAKKDKEAKKRQIIVEIKEVRLSYKIGAHDFNTRLNHARKFIDEGNKVKVCFEFDRGREMAHLEVGYQILERFEKESADFSVVEKRPVREGRRITMFLAPKKKVEEKKTPEPKTSSAVPAKETASND